MNDQPIITTFGELFVFIKEHLQLLLTKGKLEITEDVSKGLASVILIMITLGIVSSVVLVSALALILHLHELGHTYLVALLFVLGGMLLLIILLYVFRRILIINPIIGFIIRKIINK